MDEFYDFPGLEGFRCQSAPAGWWCSRNFAHGGPCAARPRWWNLKARWKMRGMLRG